MQIEPQRYSSELHALRAELEHAYREKIISKRQYAVRYQNIAGLEGEVEKLQQQISVREGQTTESFITRSLKTKLNDSEQKICAKFLEERYLQIHVLYDIARKLEKWSSSDDQSFLNRILTPLRLSWINQKNTKLNKMLNQIEDMDIELNQQIELLAEQSGLFHSNEKNSLSLVLNLLQRQEGAWSRIRSKQAELNKRTNNLARKRRESELYQSSADSSFAPQSVPCTQLSESAADSICGEMLNELNQCKSQISTLKSFIQSTLDESQITQWPGETDK